MGQSAMSVGSAHAARIEGSPYGIQSKKLAIWLFIIADAATFGAMSLWGYTTKRELSGFGSFLVMGLIGILIASVVNMFMQSGMMQWIISVLGVLIFVTGTPNTSMQSSLIYGALFGLFAYATFDLTALATLKHWSWPAAFADVSWGAVVTAVSATAGLAAARAFAAR